MTNRKRLGDEHLGHRVPPEGPGVFPPTTHDLTLIPVTSIDGRATYLKVHWPTQTRRPQTGQEMPIPREIITLPRPRSTRPLPEDPYHLPDPPTPTD